MVHWIRGAMRRAVWSFAIAAPLSGLTTPAGAQRAGVAERNGDQRYYAATVAAAALSLRLHDVVAVRLWLAEAPDSLRGWEWGYLAAAADRSAASFPATDGTITDLAVHPAGTLLAATGGNEVVLWEVGSGARVGALTGHTRPVWNARFSPSGDRVATVASDGTLRIWITATRRQEVLAEGVGHGVGAVAWHPDGRRVATVSWKRSPERGVWGVVDVWDARTGANVHHLEHGVKPITSVNYAPDGSRLYIGTWDFDLAAYATDDWRRVAHWLPPDDPNYKAVRESRPSPDGRRLAGAYDDGTVRIWDTQSGQTVHVLHRQPEGAWLSANDVVWLADGAMLASASRDLTIRLWDAATGAHLAALHGHLSAVTALAVTPDGATLFSGDQDGTVRRWDLAALAPERYRWTLPHSAYGVAVTADGRRVASAGWTGWLQVRDAADGRELARWDGHGESGVRVAWAPGGDLLASTGNDDSVKVWDMRPGTPRLLFAHAVGMQSLSVEFSPDGRSVASPAADRSVRVLSVPDGRPIATLADSVPFSDLAWHPTRRLIAAAGQDGVVRLWDPDRNEVVARLDGHGRGALQVAFTADGTGLAAASATGAVRLWDFGSRTVTREMRVPNGGQDAVAFSPDGRRLATGGGDDHVHIWDPATGAHLLAIPFEAGVYDLAWSPGGERLYVVPLDGTIRVLVGGSGLARRGE
jgi:WD40 repeat protein